MRRTADSTHLAGRLNINIHPLAVVTAVSHRIGDDAAAGGGCLGVGLPVLQWPLVWAPRRTAKNEEEEKRR